MTYSEIYVEKLQKWLENGSCQLIDVREDSEYNEAHIAQATLFPLSRLDPDEIIKTLPEGQKIVIQCKSGGRSAQACQILSAHAPDLEFYNLEGGILDWMNAGYAVKKA